MKRKKVHNKAHRIVQKQRRLSHSKEDEKKINLN